MKRVTVKIHGMHCAACEVLIERKLKRIDGVERVRVSRPKGQAEIFCDREPRFHELQNAIKSDGYTVLGINAAGEISASGNTKHDYFQIGAVALIVVAIYLILKQFNLVPDNFGVSEQMGYGFVFMIGLVAAVSTCMAVTGGLLLAVAAKYHERHPDLSGADRFRPHLYFNLGRIVSYTVLGGAVGAVGSVLSLSTSVSGVVTVLVSAVMVILGLQLLNVFPWLSRFQPRMPKFIAHRIYDSQASRQKATPFFFGATTFFLPCGFTQALQLYVLSTGDMVTGALTMLVFALGTLPGLMSVGAIMSFARGAFQRYFVKFAGVMVVLIGVFNISNGVALTQLNSSGDASVADAPAGDVQVVQDPNVRMVNGVQIVSMKVVGYEYEPANFTIQKGIPVEWQVDGSRASGCASVLTMPKMRITEMLPRSGVKTIRFTPTETGTLKFSCSMGMTTPGAAFTVVTGTSAPGNVACDPKITNCIKK